MDETVAIFGYGRFGKILAQLLAPKATLLIHDPAVEEIESGHGRLVDEIEALHADVLFYCIPIRELERILAQHVSIIKSRANKPLVLDVLSVKSYPKKLFQKYLGDDAYTILTHPMFGPDSILSDSNRDLPIVLENLNSPEVLYQRWKSLFEELGFRTLELSADEHDRLAAGSQGLTHFIGRVLDSFDFQPTTIDTLGAKKLFELREQTCNDSWDLFSDLQTLNPYTMAMRSKLGKALDTVYGALLPKQANAGTLTVGIQGGKGSFNEEALQYRIQKQGLENLTVQYLHTTENVLRELCEGRIDAGQFAIHNSTGGVVEESINAMGEWKFKIVEQYAIPIQHTLMSHPDASIDDIDTIMTHPQVLKQCRENLMRRYKTLNLTSGTGNLIDHAVVAEHLHAGKLPINIATMGSRVLAEVYGLKIIDEDLQDLKNNLTSFLWVER